METKVPPSFPCSTLHMGTQRPVVEVRLRTGASQSQQLQDSKVCRNEVYLGERPVHGKL